jgi:hypothetical protein
VADIHRLIAEIRDINPSAEAAWLATFSEADLRDYLAHLMVTLEQPSRARWVRRADSPAVSMRECA